MYRRILLKLSGEQLQGDFASGFDTERARWIARQVAPLVARGQQVVIMVGGGNYVRGAQLANEAIERVTADNIGMLSTMMNALSLASVFNAEDVPARALSNVVADQIIDGFTHRRAASHLEKNRVVIVAGGIGRPYLTTDTAAVSLALEMNCNVVLKATKVDGIFDKDPEKFADSKKLSDVTFQQALENDNIKIMDKAALGLAMEYNLPVAIFSLLGDGNIARAANNEAIGTTLRQRLINDQSF